MSDEGLTIYIGRDGAGVPDPLERYRLVLGEAYVRWLDAGATYDGPLLAGQTDEDLKMIRRGLDGSLAFDQLDDRRAATAVAANRGIRAAEKAERIAREKLLVQEGRSRSPRHRPEASQQPLAAAETKVLDGVVVSYNEHESAALIYDVDDVHRFSEDSNYHHDWMRKNGPTLARIVAVDRELAIAEELRYLERAGASRSQLPDGAKVKEIGTEASVLLAERELIETGWDRRLDRPERAERVYRDEVPHPPLLDPSYDVLSERRREDLAEQLAPLEDWVAQQPDAWVKKRHAELGPPAPLGIDPASARHAARLETKIAVMAGDRDLARENAVLFAASDPQRAGVEAATADAVQAKLESAERELDGLRGAGGVPDGPTPLEQGVGAQQQIYAREFEIRRRMDVAQGVERAIVDPPGRVRERLGPAPKVWAPERREWEGLVEEVEGRRLDELSARQEGVDLAEPDPAAEQALEARIDDYRAETGLDPAAQRQAIESGGPGYG